jgi:hypothetical protein
MVLRSLQGQLKHCGRAVRVPGRRDRRGPLRCCAAGKSGYEEKRVKLVINRIPMSPNDRERLHWTDRRKANRKWRSDIMAALDRDQFQKVRIILHRRRLLDDDNAVGSLKPVIDGLRDSGLIYDDSKRWILLTSEQVKDSDDYTEIDIEEVR